MLRRFLLPSFLLVAAGLGMAQQSRSRAFPLQRAIKSLDLSEPQVQQLRDLMEKRRAESAPLWESLRQERKALQGLMNTADPNPTQVGQAYIRMRESRKQLAASQKAFRESFKGILTEEQRAKLESVQAGRRVRPLRRAPGRLGL